MDYPAGLVEHATRTLFPNYFNGSEIIIAGKLVDKEMDRLHVEVTASNSKKFVVLKKDVPVEPRRMGNDVPGSPRPKGGGQEDPNHLERLWSYLTLKELLSSWLQSDEQPERERLRQEVQALALNHRFLAPFTSMTLKSAPRTETPEDAYGTSAATGPETVMQSLRGAHLQPGKGTLGMALLSPFQARSSVLLSRIINLINSVLYLQLLAFREWLSLCLCCYKPWISIEKFEKVKPVYR